MTHQPYYATQTYTITEAATLAGCHRRTLERAIKAGKLRRTGCGLAYIDLVRAGFIPNRQDEEPDEHLGHPGHPNNYGDHT